MSAAASCERIERYEARYVEDYAYESWLVAGRRQATLESLRGSGARTVVEVGCGSDPLVLEAIGCMPHLERWVIVEPSALFLEIAARIADVVPEARVVRGFFESSKGDVIAALGQDHADAIVIDGLLHELDDPDGLVRAARSLLAPRGLLHASVPNAFSMHRRLGRAMGLIDDVHRLSARNRHFEQRRVFDLEAFVALFARCGFAIEKTGGHTMMPFASAQMSAIEAQLGDEVFQGLTRLGEELPELAAEIYVDARRTTEGSIAP
ncbi:MAG: class I SAM-dependent methyltransferase [Sandaracinaceae bacterium]